MELRLKAQKKKFLCEDDSAKGSGKQGNDKFWTLINAFHVSDFLLIAFVFLGCFVLNEIIIVFKIRYLK